MHPRLIKPQYKKKNSNTSWWAETIHTPKRHKNCKSIIEARQQCKKCIWHRILGLHRPSPLKSEISQLSNRSIPKTVSITCWYRSNKLINIGQRRLKGNTRWTTEIATRHHSYKKCNNINSRALTCFQKKNNRREPRQIYSRWSGKRLGTNKRYARSIETDKKYQGEKCMNRWCAEHDSLWGVSNSTSWLQMFFSLNPNNISAQLW